MEISEKSENHLKAIVDGREVAEVDGVGERAGKVAEKTRGEGKAAKSGARGWQLGVGSANYRERLWSGFSARFGVKFILDSSEGR